LCNIVDNDEMADGQSVSDVNADEFVSSTNVHRDCSNAMDVTVCVSFILVDEISDALLAAEDGLQLGDQILKFAMGKMVTIYCRNLLVRLKLIRVVLYL
jgi:hypothetical protein